MTDSSWTIQLDRWKKTTWELRNAIYSGIIIFQDSTALPLLLGHLDLVQRDLHTPPHHFHSSLPNVWSQVTASPSFDSVGPARKAPLHGPASRILPKQRVLGRKWFWKNIRATWRAYVKGTNIFSMWISSKWVWTLVVTCRKLKTSYTHRICLPVMNWYASWPFELQLRSLLVARIIQVNLSWTWPFFPWGV